MRSVAGSNKSIAVKSSVPVSTSVLTTKERYRQ